MLVDVRRRRLYRQSYTILYVFYGFRSRLFRSRRRRSVSPGPPHMNNGQKGGVRARFLSDDSYVLDYKDGTRTRGTTPFELPLDEGPR